MVPRLGLAVLLWRLARGDNFIQAQRLGVCSHCKGHSTLILFVMGGWDLLSEAQTTGASSRCLVIKQSMDISTPDAIDPCHGPQ